MVIVAHPAGVDVGNNLLRKLNPTDFEALKPHLQKIALPAGTIIHEPGDQVTSCYFPCESSMATFIVMLESGQGVEAALIGREGAVGGIVSQGRLPAYSRCMVRFSGPFLRIESRRLEELKLGSISLRHIFARYADCMIAQVFQSVACNGAHTIERRAAKWLLATYDRTNRVDLPLTQEELANMLGVGRSYVSRVLQILKSRGLIELRRGSLVIRDLDGLKSQSCECNQQIQAHFEDVLSGVYPSDED